MHWGRLLSALVALSLLAASCTTGPGAVDAPVESSTTRLADVIGQVPHDPTAVLLAVSDRGRQLLVIEAGGTWRTYTTPDVGYPGRLEVDRLASVVPVKRGELTTDEIEAIAGVVGSARILEIAATDEGFADGCVVAGGTVHLSYLISGDPRSLIEVDCESGTFDELEPVGSIVAGLDPWVPDHVLDDETHVRDLASAIEANGALIIGSVIDADNGVTIKLSEVVVQRSDAEPPPDLLRLNAGAPVIEGLVAGLEVVAVVDADLRMMAIGVLVDRDLVDRGHYLGLPDLGNLIGIAQGFGYGTESYHEQQYCNLDPALAPGQPTSAYEALVAGMHFSTLRAEFFKNEAAIDEKRGAEGTVTLPLVVRGGGWSTTLVAWYVNDGEYLGQSTGVGYTNNGRQEQTRTGRVPAPAGSTIEVYVLHAEWAKRCHEFVGGGGADEFRRRASYAGSYLVEDARDVAIDTDNLEVVPKKRQP